MLPRRVLISPLCEIIRYGWASSQLGKVLVLNREWNRAKALATRSSLEVGGVVRAELLGREHPLVDQGPARQAAKIEELVVVEPRILDLALEPLADDVELALEGVVVDDPPPPADERMVDGRLDRPGPLAEGRIVGRQPPPAEEGPALPGRRSSRRGPCRRSAARGRARRRTRRRRSTAGPGARSIPRDLALRRRGRPRGGSGRAPGSGRRRRRRCCPPSRRRRDGFRFSKRLEAVADDPVRFPALQVDEEAEPAGVVLVLVRRRGPCGDGRPDPRTHW